MDHTKSEGEELRLVGSLRPARNYTRPVFTDDGQHRLYFYDASKGEKLPQEMNAQVYYAIAGDDADFLIGGDVARLDFRVRLKNLEVGANRIVGHDQPGPPTLSSSVARARVASLRARARVLAGPPMTRVAPLDHADTRRRVAAILIGSMGNLIEWYDVYAYAAFALYFAGAFFPNSDPVAQQLSTAVIFAVGFVARPFGGLVFGHFADRYGRRNALTWSVLLMCFGSLLIAVCPPYAVMGVGAPLVLAVARILQGISQGGEYGTSATYLAEIAHPEQRGFYSGVWYMTLIGGQLCAIALLLVLQKLFLTPEQLRAWGWRIPFVIGALLSVFAWWMRRDLFESAHFEAAAAVAHNDAGIGLMLRHWRSLLLVVGITVGGTSAFYTYTTYMQKFLKLSVGLTDDQTTIVVTISLLVAITLQPIYGAISDRIGRKPVLVSFGVLGTLFTYPLLTTLQQTRSPVVATLLICGAWAIVSGYTSVTAIVKAELFPTNVRATGVGLPYAATASIFGGTVDSIALAFKNAGHESWFFWYATVLILVSLLVYVFMPDMKVHSRMEQPT